MTPAAAMSAIETIIAAAWTSTPIAYPNIRFTPPDEGNWIKLDYIWGNGQIYAKGGLGAVTGILQVSVFGPKDVGDGALDTDAETLRALFNQVRLASPNTDVMFGAVSGPLRQFEESWRSIVLSAPFQVLETL